MKTISDDIEDELYEKLCKFADKTCQRAGIVREAIICYLAQMGELEVRKDRFNYRQ